MRIGIDLGGTKIEGIVMDDAGEIICRQRVSTPRGNYQEILETIGNLVLYLEKSCARTCTVGIGTPGYMCAETGLIRRGGNTVELHGKALETDLQDVLQRKVKVANDANCFTLSESLDGAGRGRDIVFGAILGTGVGGGIVIDGRLIKGRNNVAGEWGHNPFPKGSNDNFADRLCHCGKWNCLDKYLSGPGFSATYKDLTGEDLGAKEIVQRAISLESSSAVGSLDLYFDQLAIAFGMIINFLDPDVIVLGGGMSNIVQLYDAVPSLWTKYCYLDKVETELLPAKYGDSSGVRGAAWLW
ncbi:MAG: ROK family protein [Desulfotalea sp.]